MCRVGFIFHGYNQFVELEWTLHRFRHHSRYLKDAPVAVILSGDPSYEFNGQDASIVHHVPNIVRYSGLDLRGHMLSEDTTIRPGRGYRAFDDEGKKMVGNTATESMFRHYQLGMYALNYHYDVDYIVVAESNIILWEEGTILNLINRMERDNKVAAVQTVDVGGWSRGALWTPGEGCDILPQLFIVERSFCHRSGFLFDYQNTHPECMEISLGDNLSEALKYSHLSFDDDVLRGPARTQWNIHENWDWVYMMHLDRMPGSADDKSGDWNSRSAQIDFEREALRKRGVTCLECPCQSR